MVISPPSSPAKQSRGSALKLASSFAPPSKVFRTFGMPNAVAHPFTEYDHEAFAAEGGLKGPWKVYLTDRAIKAMRKQVHSGDPIAIITKKLGELSEGHFSQSNAKRIDTSGNAVPVYEAKLSRNLRLVWQVSVLEQLDGCWTQIVLVWSVETHQSLDTKIWDGLAVEQGSQPHYGKWCAARSEVPRRGHGKTDVFQPLSFGSVDGVDGGQYTTYTMARPKFAGRMGLARALVLSDDEQIELHELLALAKHVLFDRKVLASVVADDQCGAFMFAVTREEAAVIWHPGSSVTIGRSGSGKTTALVMKIFELARVLAKNQKHHGRQAFVTQSPILADRVKRFYDSLVRTESTATLSRSELVALAADASATADVDLDEDTSDTAALPSRFSELEDHHFPLFLSFNSLLRLIEADLGVRHSSSRGRARTPARGQDRAASSSSNPFAVEEPAGTQAYSCENSTTDSSTSNSTLDLHFVDSTTFVSWWPHVDQRLTKGLEPLLAWSEILGVIKGSAAVAFNSRPYLSEADYLALSDRSAPAFVGRREMIYALFKAYQSMKAEAGMYDPADRTHAIIEAFDDRRSILAACQISYLSIDEAQDLLLLDYQLLRMLCPNPAGVTIVGDTAQTIFAGSSFRFQDLTASFYIDEEQAAYLEDREPMHLKQFHFSKNFRSHGGITCCANSIVKAIYSLFPNAIDHLKDEESAVGGPSPLWIDHTTHPGDFKAFLSSGSKVQIEFGAKHCIIVRNDEARQRLRKELGNTGLILTVFESKGLEFDSCLIYHFFSDSSASASQWRTILNVGHCTDEAIPVFDPIYHAVIKSELQHFYVAITRARKSVWVIEGGEGVGEAMKIYLTAKEVLKVADPNSPLPSLGGVSTKIEWRELGQNLLEQRIFAEAAHAFSRAGEPFLEARALAHGALAAAVKTEKGYRPSPADIKEAYGGAADRFHLAAILAPNERLATRCHTVAGDCFVRADMLVEAAKEYEKGREYEKSAVSYRKAGSFEDAVRIVQGHRSDVQDETATKIIEVSKVQFARADKLDLAAQLFPTTDAYLEFLKEFVMTKATKALYLQVKDYVRAAEVCASERDFVEAAAHFGKAGAVGHARTALTNSIWACISIGSLDRPEDRKPGLDLLQALLRLGPKPGPQLETKFLSTLLAKDHDRVELVQLAQHTPSSPIYTLLALDAAVQASSMDLKYTTGKSGEYLSLLRTYCEAMRKVFAVPEREVDLSSSTIQALFGFKPDYVETLLEGEAEDAPASFRVYLLLEGSSLAAVLGSSAVAEPGQLKSVDGADIISAMRQVVFPRLYQLLERIDYDLASSPSVLPACPRHAVAGRCDGTCGQLHSASPTATTAQLRLVIDLAELMRSVLPWLDQARMPSISHDGCRRMQREWIERLVYLATPCRPHIGGDLNEIADRVDAQDWHRFRQLLSTYSISRLYELRDYTTHYFASAALVAAVTAMQLAGLTFTDSYRRFPMSRSANLPPKFVTPRGHSIFFDLGRGIESFTWHHVSNDGVGDVVDFAIFALTTSIRVDCGALLRLLEEATFLAVLSLRQSPVGEQSPWHGMILPRSTAKGLLRKHQHHGSVRITENFLQGCVEALKLFLVALGETQDANWFLYNAGRTMRSRAYVRHLFAARACQVLALVGLNYQPFRSRVVSGLRQAGSRHDARFVEKLYAPFLFPTDWMTIQNMLLEPTYPRDSSEELVALLLPGALPPLPRRGVRTLRANSLSALLVALSPRESNLSPTASAFEPSTTASWSSAGADAPPEEREAEPSVDPRHVAAVSDIQSWYRRRLRLISTRATPSPRQRAFLGVAAEMRRTVADALEPALDRASLRGKIILGPLVELSFALGESHKLVIDRRKRLQKKDLPHVEHEDLEIVMGLLAKASDLAKRLNSLLKVASPTHQPFAAAEPLHAITTRVRGKLEHLALLVEDVDQLLAARSSAGLPADVKCAFAVVLVWLEASGRAGQKWGGLIG